MQLGGIMKRKRQIPIEGMHCAACSTRIEKALERNPSIFLARVNLATEIATVEYDDKSINNEAIDAIIRKIGYDVKPTMPDAEMERITLQAARRRLTIAWVFTGLIMLWMIPDMIFHTMITSHTIMQLVLIILALPVIVFCGYPTFKGAFKTVLHGSADMDVLIATGTGAAFITGPLSFFIPIANYAAISAMILAFQLTGKYMETKAKGKASSAIRKLLDLGAKTAIIEKEGKELEIPITQVVIDDIMIVKPGTKIPTDGMVVEGESGVDESMATGESMPVMKKNGDEVIGATIVQNGFLKVKATRIGKDTFLAQVIQMVEDAQTSKVPIQTFADKVISIFVPAVLGIALLTFLAWFIFPDSLRMITNWAQSFLPWVNPDLGRLTGAIYAMIAVLVIACPCALGLATPTALMVGSGMGAEKGVLIRTGDALQTMQDVKIVVFDKTGTLTYGKPELLAIVPVNPDDERIIMEIAAGLESVSEHTLAHAVLQKASDMKIDHVSPSAFEAIQGKGIKGTIHDMEYYLGSRIWLNENKIDTLELDTNPLLQNHPEATLLYLASRNTLLGALVVADKVRTEAAEVIAKLHSMGIKTALLSGDLKKTANAIAKRLGIDRVDAEVLPGEKARIIQSYKEQYGIVAMIGDGINDAPALKQADIGIAMGMGTDIAIEAADITLVRNHLESLIVAVNLSKETFKKIKQNLFWAFFYNLIAIPLAIMGLLHPLIAEAAMATSSVTVVTNANLLRRKNLLPLQMVSGNR
jgi:P-type Cu+ transporter